MTSSRFDPGSTSVRPQKPWTSPFYGSMNGPGLKTLIQHLKSLKNLQFYEMPTELVLSMQPEEGPEFWKLFIFWIGFKGNATKSTNSVIQSYCSFCKGNSRNGEPKCAHHFWEILGIFFKPLHYLLYLRYYQRLRLTIIFFSFILLLQHNE